MVGRRDGWENGVLRMPFLRRPCDILSAAPPHAGRGKQSRGAVAEDRVTVPWLYLRPVARTGASKGSVKVGDWTARGR